MKLERTFDGFKLIAVSKKEKELIREAWNHTHPKIPVKQLRHSGEVKDWEPSLVLHFAKDKSIRVFVYCGDRS